MPKSLADGNRKFTILTVAPANPAQPTAAELNAGLDISCDVLASDFTFTATDSDKIAEKALCSTSNANSLGADNFQVGFSLWRYFNGATGKADVVEGIAYEAVKTKGTSIHGYLRETGQPQETAWADDDEITVGMEFVTDHPQAPSDQGGWIKRRIPCEAQRGWLNRVVGPGSAPTITAATPSAAAEDASLVITGTGFSGVTGPAGVTIGGVNAKSYTVDSATQITAVVPAGSAGSAPITVTHPVTGASTAFAYTRGA